jgi:flavine halogenase
MLANATLTKKHGGPTGIQQAADYSYSASSYAGDHYRIAGDAGAFIDPFFSSGVHLAFTGALSAAATICASIRGDVPETEAQEFHTKKIGVAFTRFLLVVLASYRQMRNQEMDVLSSVDQDNFDAAFKSIRPIIQGLSERELDDKLTEEELRDTMSFVVNVFASNPEEADRMVDEGRLKEHMVKADQTSVEDVIKAVKSAADEEARSAVLWANARKPLATVYNAPKNFREEEILGGVVRMEIGKLGIQSASTPA